MATEAVSVGGQGEILANPAPSRSDLRLVRKAINGGYNLTPEQRQLIVARAVEILEAAPEVLADKDGHALGVSYRDQLAAAKVLLAADKMDLDVERLAAGVASGVTHNTQVNIDARGNQELVAELKKQLTLAERERLLEKLESGNGNGKTH